MKARRCGAMRGVGTAICLVLALACGRKHQRIANLPSTPQPAAPPSASPSNKPSRASAPPQSQPGTAVPAAALPAAALPVGYVEEGVASWYGVPYHGRAAADGEIYDMETLVAAHRVMPFNTWVKVTNLANGKTVNVRIIDRGPFVEGRIVDLSKAAARQIELLGPGVGRVRLEVIAAPMDIPADDFYGVQVGAFSVEENAEHARFLYAQRFGAASVAPKQGRLPLWRVIVGREPSVQAAQRLAAVLTPENKNVFVVRLDEQTPPRVKIAPSAQASVDNAQGPADQSLPDPPQAPPQE